MFDRTAIARKSLSLALAIRSQNAIETDRPICPIDLCERLGIEVRFAAIPSMEGMYVSDSIRAIVLSSLRPAGRRRFTCAHELGHSLFGHGSRLDEFEDHRTGKRAYDADEFAADLFAGHLLMTKKAVLKGFNLRHIEVPQIGPVEVFQVAGWLGVGYATLLLHMSKSLGLIPESQAQALLRKSPAQIKRIILGHNHAGELLCVDENWIGRPVDADVGDLIATPPGCEVDGNTLDRMTNSGHLDLGLNNHCIYEVNKPGICRIESVPPGWAVYVRSSRRQYIGRGRFRHIPDDEDE